MVIPKGRDRLRLGVWCALVFGLAWLPHLTRRLLATDDYSLLNRDGSSWTPLWMFTEGRFVTAALHGFLTALGLEPLRSAPAIGVVTLALCVACALLLARAWRLDAARDPLSLLVLLLPFVHPFNAEVWSFRSAAFNLFAADALALGGVVVLRGGGRRAPLFGTALYVAALATYPTSINVVLVVGALGLALALVNTPAGEERSAELRSWGRVLLFAALAAPLWLLASRALLFAFQVAPGARNALVDPHQWHARLRDLGRALAKVALREQQLATPLLRGLQLALLALGLAAAGLATSARRADLLRVVLLLAAALLAVVGVGALPATFEPSARVLTAAGFFWAGALLLAGTAKTLWLRRAAVVCAALVVVGSIGVDHRFADELARLNLREQAIASRLLARLETHPRGALLRRFVTRGHSVNYQDLPTLANFVAPSALAVPWSQAALLSDLAHRPIADATPADLAAADALCATSGKFPAADSVTVTEDGLGIACF